MQPQEQQEPSSQSSFFASLVYRDYRCLWVATACGQAALWALVVLWGALVYELTNSNAWVGFVTMAAHLPSLVVTPFAGFLADRLSAATSWPSPLASTWGRICSWPVS
jgi:hypothetical protein